MRSMSANSLRRLPSPVRASVVASVAAPARPDRVVERDEKATRRNTIAIDRADRGHRSATAPRRRRSRASALRERVSSCASRPPGLVARAELQRGLRRCVARRREPRCGRRTRSSCWLSAPMRAGALLWPRLASVATEALKALFASAIRGVVWAGTGTCGRRDGRRVECDREERALLVSELRDHDLRMPRLVDAALEPHDGAERDQAEQPDAQPAAPAARPNPPPRRSRRRRPVAGGSDPDWPGEELWFRNIRCLIVFGIQRRGHWERAVQWLQSYRSSTTAENT